MSEPVRSAAEIQRVLRGSRSVEAPDRLRLAGRKAAGPVAQEESARTEQSHGPSRADYLSVKGALQERLMREIGNRNLFGLPESEVVSAVREFTTRVLETEDIPLNDDERGRLAEELIEETTGLGPLAPLMADPAITDILVNGPNQVWVERFGRLEHTAIRFRDHDQIARVIERIAAAVGRRVDTASPMVDLRLADGSRVNATLPPVTVDGPTISIRRFGRRRLRRDDLLGLGMMSREMLAFLDVIVRNRANVLIPGGTGAGKSTLLGALAEIISAAERIITIEDTAELVLDQEHWVRMETRPPNIEGRGRIDARDLGFAVLITAILDLFENSRADKQVEQIEAQLADAIDLLTASLRAGSALLAALDATGREARMPLREELENMVGRIRIGDDPRAVAQELARRVPLESFRLFAHTLLIHWETGGSLTSSLRTVGRTVRDRLEVSRRISAQAIEAQVSVFAVMLITWGLLGFMLRSNPGPMKNLLFSQIGSIAATVLMIMQAAGMVWIWRMSRIRF